ncbi:MAG: hypothetical protein DRI32_01135 [Chloroflexi bacterium]|nr:MAG: hypothetical protein DRI32_01135 [Chloroflexota bacterium]
MKKILTSWHLLLGFILGLGLGLVISWTIIPQTTPATSPSQLRDDFKDSYRALIAAAYASTGNLPRAQSRLAALNDPDSVVAIKSQAQRALAKGDSPESLDALAALVANLEKEISATEITAASIPTQTPQIATKTGIAPTATESASTPEPPMPTLTEIPFFTRTPASITTASPTPGAPYVLQTQDEICSVNLSEGLLMVYVSDKSNKAVAGVEIIVTWGGNEEHFFTGLKPELGNGYADFAMEPGKTYALRLAAGSTAASNLSIPSCQDDEGNPYWGVLRLKFQQP